MPSLNDLTRDVADALTGGFGDGARGLLARAVALSSGPFSPSSLAAMDHPYARRHGSPRLDPSTINVQSGAFRSRWRLTGFGLAQTLVNDDPKADLLTKGTRAMFARPIDARLEAEGEAIVEAAVEARLLKTLSQTYS